jgi:NAD(P)-dependent dehydrogenase (short-subunit alcohol dehydrogenase family)
MIKQVLKKMLKKLRAKQLVPIVTPVDKDKMLENKVVLITGGSSGIGLSIAEACLKSGAKVIIAGSTQSKIDDVLKEKKNPNLAGIVINIMDVSSLNNKVFEAASIFNGKIDVLINSAGAHHTHQFEDMPENEFDKIMNTNVKGTFFMCQKVVEHMKKNGIKGHILNISSSSALRPAWGPYQMSKWAIAGFTKGLAEKCQPYGIVVNALAPGQTATPMLGISNDDIYNGYAMAGRYIMPQEIANLAVFMISDMGNMIVGDTFYMTGGSGVVTFNG